MKFLGNVWKLNLKYLTHTGTVEGRRAIRKQLVNNNVIKSDLQFVNDVYINKEQEVWESHKFDRAYKRSRTCFVGSR